MTEPKCKWLSDDDQEVCVNADCPVCADFCPVCNYPEICKFAEIEGQKRTVGNKVRSMDDAELAEILEYAESYRPNGVSFYEWLKQEAEDG